MSEVVETFRSSTQEYPTAVDVYSHLLTQNQDQISGGGSITFYDPDYDYRRWIRVEDIRIENRIKVIFPIYNTSVSRSAASEIIRFASCLQFKEYDPNTACEIWEASGPLSTFSNEKLAETFDQIFRKIFGLASDYVVEGICGYKFTPKSVPWEYGTTLLQEKECYLEEELRARIAKDPKDAKASLMLAERTDDLEERIDLVRNNISNKDWDLDNEGKKAWLRLHAELPSTSFQSHDSIQSFPGVEKLDLTTEGLSETIFLVSDHTIPGGKHQVCFQRGHHPLKERTYFDRIIKLSWGHFLCQTGSRYSLWYCYDRNFLLPGPTFEMVGESTLEKFIKVIPSLEPKIQHLAEYIHKDAVSGRICIGVQEIYLGI